MTKLRFVFVGRWNRLKNVQLIQHRSFSLRKSTTYITNRLFMNDTAAFMTGWTTTVITIIVIKYTAPRIVCVRVFFCILKLRLNTIVLRDPGLKTHSPGPPTIVWNSIEF